MGDENKFECGVNFCCSECVDKDICPYYLERLDEEED